MTNIDARVLMLWMESVDPSTIESLTDSMSRMGISRQMFIGIPQYPKIPTHNYPLSSEIGFDDTVHLIIRIFVIPSGVIGGGRQTGGRPLGSKSERRRWKRIPLDLRTFMSLSLVIAIPANALMLLLPSDSSIDSYIGSTSFEMLFFATVLLLLVILKVKDRSFRTTSVLVAFGFLFQLIASGIWYYFDFVVQSRATTHANIGDVFHLGSYFFWMAAAVPYLRRYRRLMGGNSLSVLLSYTALGTTASIISLNNLYNTSGAVYRNDMATMISGLSYTLIPAVCLIVPLSALLIYIFDGYGRGLKRYYWMYSLFPILLIASSDLLRSTYLSIYGASVPFRLDDAIALTGYATAISAALRLLRSQMDTVFSIPLVLEEDGAQLRTVLKSGKGYAVEDSKPDTGFEMFSHLITAASSGQKQRGYIISGIDTIEIFQKYGLRGMQFTLLGSNAGGKAEDEDRLTSLAQSIREYLLETKNGVVLLDGINLLISENGFKEVNVLLEQISDFTVQYNSYVIMPIDAKDLSAKEIAKIKRLFKTISIGSRPSFAD